MIEGNRRLIKNLNANKTLLFIYFISTTSSILLFVVSSNETPPL